MKGGNSMKKVGNHCFKTMWLQLNPPSNSIFLFCFNRVSEKSYLKSIANTSLCLLPTTFTVIQALKIMIRPLHYLYWINFL